MELLSHVISLVVAYVLALLIGWNREREERSAGIRTFPLVAMAACGFVLVAISVLGATSAGQPRGNFRRQRGTWTSPEWIVDGIDHSRKVQHVVAEPADVGAAVLRQPLKHRHSTLGYVSPIQFEEALKA